VSAVRIRATCHACERDFLFFELYNADRWHADRCPHCQTHLGVSGARQLMLAADRAGLGLVQALTELAAREPAFTVKADSVLDRIESAVSALADPDHETVATRRWWSRRAA
jgi:hypothetical protein